MISVFILFFSFCATAQSSDEAALHDRERLAGIEAYKAQRAQEEAEAERARRDFVQSQRQKNIKDREATPEFRRWQNERDQRRAQKEALRRKEATRVRSQTRDRDSAVIVPQSERVDHSKRALFNSAKSSSSSGSSVGSSSSFGGAPEFSPPPPPPPPSYGNTFAPPAPDIYEPDPNGFDSQMQMGDEIPPPIFDEADF